MTVYSFVRSGRSDWCKVLRDDTIIAERVWHTDAEVIVATLNLAPLLAASLKQCADELENEIRDNYEGLLDYPHNQVKLERDMDSVIHARMLLAKM